jgi:transposase-like protein
MASQVKSPMKKYTIEQFNQQFPDEDACLEWLRNKLYPSLIFCQNCRKPTKHHRIASRKVYGCDYCGHQISPTAGTIFHKSPTPLRLWFYAIYLMAQTRGGISAKQLQRELGVTYKTAWRMFKMIRSRLDEGLSAFSSDVEVDETYVGGVRKGKRGRGAAGKTAVVGVVERKGKIKAVVVPDTKKNTINKIVENQIEVGATVHTDEYASYNDLTKKGYDHKRILHSSEIYVIGDVHTNTIEGFWALVKNGITGVYHQVGKAYLQSYVNEYAFRYNHRNDVTPMFLTFLERASIH